MTVNDSLLFWFVFPQRQTDGEGFQQGRSPRPKPPDEDDNNYQQGGSYVTSNSIDDRAELLDRFLQLYGDMER